MTVAVDSTNEALDRLGWSRFFADAFEPFAAEGLEPGRVGVQHRGAYVVYTEAGDQWAELAGKLRHEASAATDLPAVGDWVALRPAASDGRAAIHAVLPRRTKFSRKVAWKNVEEQVVAANADTVFLTSSLNRDLNPRRIERYLATAWESGSDPVIVLTKSDLCTEIPKLVAEVEAVAYGVPIHVVSCLTGEGIDELAPYFAGHRTVALLGSSGVGKSTLINRLIGEERQVVLEIRASDDRGRHATTRRELIVLPSGGLVVDTPGMRELQLWDADEGIDDAFADLTSLFDECRFADCAHESEPGCAVQLALAEGSLDPTRLESYRKLQRELEALHLRQDKRAAADARRQRRAQARQRRRPKKW